MTTQVNILQKLAACRARVAASLYVAMMATQVAAVSGAVAAEPAPEAPQTARQRAPYDLTGYWVAVVTTDWRMRMVVPGKGEYDGVPLNLAAKSFADFALVLQRPASRRDRLPRIQQAMHAVFDLGAQGLAGVAAELGIVPFRPLGQRIGDEV